jgi:hypothetical protein
MKKIVLFVAAAVAVAFAACNACQENAEEAVVEEVAADTLVAEVADSAVVVEEVAADSVVAE